MNGQRIKIILLWGFLIFLVTNLSAFLLVLLLGQVIGLILTIPIAVIFAGFAGYKAALGVSKIEPPRGNHQFLLVGVTVALLSSLFSAVVLYIFTQQLNYSSGLFTLVAAAVGGYLVDKKNPKR